MPWAVLDIDSFGWEQPFELRMAEAEEHVTTWGGGGKTKPVLGIPRSYIHIEIISPLVKKISQLKVSHEAHVNISLVEISGGTHI